MAVYDCGACPMTDIDFLLKMIKALPDTRQTDLYLLLQDKVMRRIDYPQPGERFNPARCPHATSKAPPQHAAPGS